MSILQHCRTHSTRLCWPSVWSMSGPGLHHPVSNQGRPGLVGPPTKPEEGEQVAGCRGSISFSSCFWIPAPGPYLHYTLPVVNSGLQITYLN
ncbi:hypothetical protein BD311DRAFT_747093 [Dichomitus squalens]|uniref:Uncharacterized protein n=1 Tax=Dichomitus squalens TaxID=114155 RepID=A0A4Q9N1R4_9APHY|nr:hypothetical protein BD311DRAFT_747093 [Dichomitus squalens]